MNDKLPFKKRRNYKKGIYILPNLITTLSLFFGFHSIILSINGNFENAAYNIIYAAICDALDGTIARATKTTSNFGVEYDSLCDLVSFGVAPAILVYLWALQPEQLSIFFNKSNQVGFIAAFFFATCGALRLARFNVQSGIHTPGFFQGLPIPAGACIISTLVLWHHNKDAKFYEPNSLIVLILVIILSYLLISNLNYLSHKNKKIFRSQKPTKILMIAAIIIAFIAIRPNKHLFYLAMIYLALGPIITIFRRLKNKNTPEETITSDDNKKIK